MFYTNWRKSAIVCAAVAVILASAVLTSTASAAVTWDTLIIRNGNDVNSTPPIITQNGANGVTASIWIASQKAGFGTDYFNGQPLSQVQQLTYTRLDSGTTTSSPYLNIWVTDGTHYAIVAPHSTTNGGASPSFGGTPPDIQGNNVNGLSLQTLGFSVYENSNGADYTWMYPNAARPNGAGVLVDSSDSNSVITLSDIANLMVMNPNNVIGSGWTGGTGAPKGSNGFVIMFGDKQVDGLGNAVPYQLGNATVPEPASLSLLALGGLVLLKRRRRSA